MRAAAVSILALTAVTGAALAPAGGTLPARERPSISSPPAQLIPGRAWHATVRAGGARRRLVVTATADGARRRFLGVPKGRGRYAVRIVLPFTGRWRLAVASALLRSVSVRLPIVEAYRVLVEPAGTLLVADGGHGRGRIVRIDPLNRRRSVFLDFSGRISALEPGAGGSLYALIADRLIRIDSRRRLHSVVGIRFAGAAGLAVASDGSFYVSESEGNRVRRVSQKTVTTVAAGGLDQPIGVAVTDSGLYVSDSHHGRVVRVGSGGTLATVLDGLALPAFLGVDRDGSLLVVDHTGHQALGRILRLRADGSTEMLVDRTIRAPTSIAVAPDGTRYGTNFEGVGRIDARGRLVPLG